MSSEGHDFTTRAGVLARHGEIADLLAQAHRELATTLQAEKEAKITSFEATGGTTDKIRDNRAGFNALDDTKAVFELRGEIAALTEERDHLRFLLVHGSFT